MSLWQEFLDIDGKVSRRWTHYFPIYERHFSSFRNKSITFLEIGVNRGGSLRMWQRYFGPLARIIGIDINERCKEHEAPGIAVRIGDQGDEKFLQGVIDEFGVPDIVLDDGSHQMHHIAKSFDFLYPKLSKSGIYMVEDLHTAYWDEFGGGLEKPESFVNVSKGFVDRLYAEHSRGAVAPDFMTRHTFSINFYDGIVAFERGDMWRKESIRAGNQSLLSKANARISRIIGR